MQKIGIISQARTTSSRLPNKIFKNILDKPLLQYHTERLALAHLPVFIATTTNQTDDTIVDYCKIHNLPYYRGDEYHVLSRYFHTANENNLDIIVRVTSDCPLIDGALISKGVETYLNQKKDWLYLSNSLKRTYPRGFDFEIFSIEMLNEAFEKATDRFETEHVTPYFYQNKHQPTHLYSFENSADFSSHRLTVDEIDDFKLIKKLIEEYRCDLMDVNEICKLLEKHPELKKINIHVEQKKT